MKALVTAVAIATMGLLAGSNSLSAQGIWVGGGATFPVSDYGDYADTGFFTQAGYGHPVGESGLGIFGGGFYGQNSHSDVDGDKTSVYGFMGGVGYDFAGPDADSSLYTYGELGILWHKFSSDTFEEGTDSGLGFGGGLGYFFPLGESINGWIEGRVTHASIDDSNTSFFGIIAGIGIPLGD